MHAAMTCMTVPGKSQLYEVDSAHPYVGSGD